MAVGCHPGGRSELARQEDAPEGPLRPRCVLQAHGPGPTDRRLPMPAPVPRRPSCTRIAGSRHNSPSDQAPQHRLRPGRPVVVVGGLAAQRVEIDLEAGVVADLRGRPPADPSIARPAVRHPEPDVRRSREAVVGEPHAVASLHLEAAHRAPSPSRSLALHETPTVGARLVTTLWPGPRWTRSVRGLAGCSTRTTCTASAARGVGSCRRGLRPPTHGERPAGSGAEHQAVFNRSGGGMPGPAAHPPP